MFFVESITSAELAAVITSKICCISAVRLALGIVRNIEAINSPKLPSVSLENIVSVIRVNAFDVTLNASTTSLLVEARFSCSDKSLAILLRLVSSFEGIRDATSKI